MRILLHDFSGHPFQIDLSRRLAKRGHTILHVHCPSYATGKGRLEGDQRLRVVEIAMGREFARYSPLRRLGQELAYGIRFTAVAREFRPDVIISCNDPLCAKVVAGLWSRWRNIPWLFWLQDLYSVAISRELENRHVPLGDQLGRAVRSIEGWLLRSANAVVAITDDFIPELRLWGVDLANCAIVENWAPIDELPMRKRENAWRSSLGLNGTIAFVYSGTLGLKHNPDILYALAERLDQAEADVVVVSEGMGIDRLRDLQKQHPLPNLRLLPFQSYSALPDVLGSADVLLVLLEPQAGKFSVPSKVLTCLCAGRPILAMVPAENLAAKTIERVGAGTVIDPDNREGLFEAATLMMHDANLRNSSGQRARAYAETAFDGEAIADRFESLLERIATPCQVSHP